MAPTAVRAERMCETKLCASAGPVEAAFPKAKTIPVRGAPPPLNDPESPLRKKAGFRAVYPRSGKVNRNSRLSFCTVFRAFGRVETRAVGRTL